MASSSSMAAAATSICMSSLSYTTQARTRISFMKPAASSSASLSIKSNSFPSLKLRSSAPLRYRVVCAAAKPETVDKVCDIVRKQLALPVETAVTGSSKFADLGADSLDTVEIVMGLEEEFGITVEEESAQAIATVQDAADMIEKLVESKAAA